MCYKENTLNKRTELFAKCHHKNRFGARNQGTYIPGGETRLQSAERCVMRQRSVVRACFLNEFGKERDFVVLSLCGFYSGFLRSFKNFLT